MQLITNEQQKELKSHGSFEFPVFVSEEVLSHYERGSFLWHWHPEIELTFVTEGEISYQVNDKIYTLHTGEGLFCNSNALHTGHMIDQKNCYYISITFHPRIIYGYEGSILHQNYVKPVITAGSFGSFFISPKISWQKQILILMKEIYQLFSEHKDMFEFQIQQKLSAVWLSILENKKEDLQISVKKERAGHDLERIREILTYIHTHYMEKITLEEIAAQIGLCKGECCRFFKKHMNQSLFDYILYYRVEKSLLLLAQKNLSVTEIAEQTGFSNSSYYARVFKEQMNCSPSQYRNRYMLSFTIH
ncbi:MAG: AraC family transcriptional regulator [Lachnospiraceae bacterium]|nr:AraC family transcriptional regulator [Lachnospiraceae bacterium]